MIRIVFIFAFLSFAWNVSTFALTSLSFLTRRTHPTSRLAHVTQSSEVQHAGLPLILQTLYCGDSLLGYRRTENGLHNVTVERISEMPPMYAMRNLVTPTECHAIQSAVSTMSPAQTVSGHREDEIRKHSHVTWLRNEDVDGLVGRLAEAVRSMMISSPDIGVEDMQVVRYSEGGEYALHHDGNDRILTVIYYLNGQGETWFPLADGESRPEDTQQDALKRAEGLKPGMDGVLVSTSHSTQSKAYVPLNLGDAVAFYSYLRDGRMDWSAIHAGLPACEEKFVANHFFRPIPRSNQE